MKAILKDLKTLSEAKADLKASEANTYRNIADQLRAARVKAKLSLRDLASAMGKSAAATSHLERGLTAITEQTVRAYFAAIRQCKK